MKLLNLVRLRIPRRLGRTVQLAVIVMLAQIIAAALLMKTGWRLPCECPAHQPRPLNPMLATTAAWLHQRNYSFVTNVAGTQTRLVAEFATFPGDALSATFTFSTDEATNTLRAHVIFSPGIANDDSSTTLEWLAEANEKTSLGTFGFDTIERKFWFRIELLRLDHRVSDEELDWIMEEANAAVRRTHEFLISELPVDATQLLLPPPPPPTPPVFLPPVTLISKPGPAADEPRPRPSR
jgi:hypothetical protein